MRLDEIYTCFYLDAIFAKKEEEENSESLSKEIFLINLK